jgi:hypothetical protein
MEAASYLSRDKLWRWPDVCSSFSCGLNEEKRKEKTKVHGILPNPTYADLRSTEYKAPTIHLSSTSGFSVSDSGTGAVRCESSTRYAQNTKVICQRRRHVHKLLRIRVASYKVGWFQKLGMFIRYFGTE